MWQATVDINAPGAKRKAATKSFPTRKEAVEWVAERQLTVKAGMFVEPHRLTVGAYLDRWFVATADLKGWEENTRRDYLGSIERLIKPRLGDLLLRSLTTDDVGGFYAWLLREGRKGGGSLSRKTVHNVEICLRSALQSAVARKLLTSNPASGAFKFSRKSRAEMKTWTTEQAQVFLDFTAQDRDATLYRVALMTGMRRGELLGLRRRDFKGALLEVRQQWCRNGAKGLAFKGLKNDSAGWRTIDLDPVTVDQLQAHLDAQAFERRRDDYQDFDLVFANQDGTPYDPDSVTRRFERRSQDAVQPVIRLHDLRHTHATLLRENGESIEYVAERLGDRVETVLATYAHVTSKMRVVAPSRLAAMIDAPRNTATLADRM